MKATTNKQSLNSIETGIISNASSTQPYVANVMYILKPNSRIRLSVNQRFVYNGCLKGLLMLNAIATTRY